MSTTAKTDILYDVVVVGGGPVGLATAYEVAKNNGSVLVLEQSTFFNSAGSSGDLVRMFRTMYTEDYMAKLAKYAMQDWDELESDAGTSLRLMTGLLNFGDPNLGQNTPEGSLFGPVDNLDKLGMSYKKYENIADVEKKWPFKNLDRSWKGLFAPDNGVINVTLLTRTLARLAKDYGADAMSNTQVHKLSPIKLDDGGDAWQIQAQQHHPDKPPTPLNFRARKIVIAAGAYVNHILAPSFNIALDLDIWEMTASYFNLNPGPGGTIFPSMWFQFANDAILPNGEKRSRLFYGFPSVEWGPPNLVRIAVDAATNTIKDPKHRKANVISPEDIADVQDFVRDHVKGADASCPAYSASCLQTNVFDNMFVLDYVPEEHLRGGAKDSIVVFTAGWAMKFVPLLGKILRALAVDGDAAEFDYALDHFRITRADKTGKPILVPSKESSVSEEESMFSMQGQAAGSSYGSVQTAS